MELYDYEKKHIEYLRSHIGECTLFLKRDSSFPLNAPCRIAAYGNGVRKTVKGGTGSGEVNSRYFINVEKGLEDAGFEITSRDWLNSYDKVYTEARKSFVKQIKKVARQRHTLALVYGMGKIMPEPEYDLPLDADGDAAIYVLSRISGEGSDRQFIKGDILLSETERRDILYLNSKFEKFMLVLNVGGVIDLSELGDVKNILLLSQLGVETGYALADILLGKIYPSGKLTTSWAEPCSYSHLDFGNKDDTRYKEGIYVGYRYFDVMGIEPLYPFGFGLGYTDFQINNTVVTAEKTEIHIKATVLNIGNYKGKEVVQAYISAPNGNLDKPRCELCAFKKTKELSPLESDFAELKFDLRDMCSYDEKREAYVLEKGEYILYIGSSLKNKSPVAKLNLDGDVFVFKVKNLCGPYDFKDFAPKNIERAAVKDKIPVINISASDFYEKSADYHKEEITEENVKALSDNELAHLIVGYFNPKGGILSIIGNASSKVAGAAGETTSLLMDKDILPVIMADGPSGVRVSRQFYRDTKGNAHPIGQGGIPESVMEFLAKPLQKLLNAFVGKNKPPRGAKIEEQYATAFPIGTALAQSWNLDFLYECGNIIGEEMRLFNVNLWLAPALNIHRSIQCGRNYEYYSEDPFLSGKVAAAITRGVQSHSGCGVTIKHYAANNQETNRYGSNSIVSERAMREIYLKGFAICIKESNPMSIMTSYNLLNGIHTSEHKGIMRGFLREELDYNGVIMTDWIVNGSMMADKHDKHPRPTPYKIAAAGGDLVMPGCKGDVKSILKGLNKGELTRAQVQKNASRVYKMTKTLNKR